MIYILFSSDDWFWQVYNDVFFDDQKANELMAELKERHIDWVMKLVKEI